MSICGGNFTGSGIITSPSYPNQYPHNADCIFVISQPIGTYIELNILNIDISCLDIGPDYLEIRDGLLENSPLIGIFCGDTETVPGSVDSTQNHMRIR